MEEEEEEEEDESSNSTASSPCLMHKEQQSRCDAPQGAKLTRTKVTSYCVCTVAVHGATAH